MAEILDVYAAEAEARKYRDMAATEVLTGLGYRWEGYSWVAPAALTAAQQQGQVAPASAPVGGMTKDSRVPDDYRNQASGYRAGWNDALASDLAQQPAAVDEAMVERACVAFGEEYGGFRVSRVKMRAALTAARATQHQEPTT